MRLSITNRRILPGFGISLGSSVLFICLILLLPLSALIIQLAQSSWSEYFAIITHPQMLAAYYITVLSAGIASLFNVFFGLNMAWILTRYNFIGRRFLDGLIDLPFALPTAVAGLTLAGIFSAKGWYGRWLMELGIQVSYTWLGIIVAMVFTSFPFVVRSVQPVLEELNQEYEEAAQILGASKQKVFVKVILPEIYPALLTGMVLSFTRCLGEFGAIIFIAGNIAWQTEVVSLLIFIRLQEFDYVAASAIASVILATSLILLGIVNILQTRFGRRVGGRI